MGNVVADQQLTEHFRLHELTRTDLAQYQAENRDLSPSQIMKLTTLAKLGEHVRFVTGGRKIIVHSGYRCPRLNRVVKSTAASQHLLCEAMDFVVDGLDLEEAFQLLRKDVKIAGANVGQLIHETADRSYGVASWIHISLGTPYRALDRCKQVLRMVDGQYQMLS